jgi:hypothetical protein
MRRHLGLRALMAVMTLAALAGGCATVDYRVPSSEVKRLVQLPPVIRHREIRVVPAQTPEGPPLTAADLAPSAPPPAPAPPAIIEPPAEAMVEAEPIAQPPEVGGVAVQLDVSPPPVRLAAPRVVVAAPARAPVVVHAPAPVARPPAVRAPPVGAPAVRAPAVHHGGGSGGGHRGAHGGHMNGGAALVALVVLPIIVIAIVASSIAEANAEAAQARAFDGWVTVAPDHLLRLHYAGDLERLVPLTTLTVSDLIGLRYAVLRDSDGTVTRQGSFGR